MASQSVKAFPASANMRHVKQAAEMLNQTHGEAAVAAWKALIRSIADPLLAMGISQEEVSRHVLEFQHSVQMELRTLAYESREFQLRT